MGKIYFDYKEGVWWRPTSKPKLEDRPLPAPERKSGKQ